MRIFSIIFISIIPLVPGCVNTFLKVGDKRERKQLQTVRLGISVVSKKGFVRSGWSGFWVVRKRHNNHRDGMRGKRGIGFIHCTSSTQSLMFLMKFLNSQESVSFLLQDSYTAPDTFFTLWINSTDRVWLDWFCIVVPGVNILVGPSWSEELHKGKPHHAQPMCDWLGAWVNLLFFIQTPMTYVITGFMFLTQYTLKELQWRVE